MRRLFILFCIIPALAISANSYAQADNQNYIEVHGTAERTVSPDKISLSITISENDYRKRSLSTLEKEMKSALSGIGLDIKNSLKVENISSSFSKGKTNSPDAVLSKRYTLVVGDAKAASNAIEALEKVYISNVYIQKEEYTKMDSLKIAIKADAMKNAKDIASAMAEAIGQKIGRAIYIYEYESRSDSYRPMMMKAMSNVDSLVEETYEEDLEFKEMKVSCNVMVRFSLPDDDLPERK